MGLLRGLHEVTEENSACHRVSTQYMLSVTITVRQGRLFGGGGPELECNMAERPGKG